MHQKHHDLIIVLGSRQNPATGEFPSHVTTSLNKAASMIAKSDAPAIAVSGKWALEFDDEGIVPLETESALMQKLLLEKGVPVSKILQESESKDTVANFYFLKQTILKPHDYKKLLFIIADFRVERARYLADKILGPDYVVDFLSVESKLEDHYPHEPQTFARTQYYLEAMQPGDDQFVARMFYDHPFYTAKWPIDKKAE